jgi:predicted MFS family arabinose efflux permease
MTSEAPKKPTPFELVVVLFFTTAVMTLAATAMLWIPAIAPAVAGDIGVSASLVGYQFTIAYMGAMASSLFAGPLVQRWGAWRTSQASLAFLATGHLIMMSGIPTVMIVGSVVTGLGYGMMNPPALDLLNRVASAGNRNLVFSIRFTGVPLGGVFASLVAPPLALELGWQATMLVVGGLGLALFAAMQPFRAKWDADRDPATRVIRDPFAGLRLVLTNFPLRCLAFTGLCFAGIQLSLTSFTVTVLVEEVGWTLVTAGVALSCVQVAGVIGRVGWGMIADRFQASTAVLIFIGITNTIGSIVASQLSESWPQIAVMVFFFVFGVVAVGWNGVFASEAARISPPGRVSHATGGVLFVTFAGVLAGPVVFSTVFAVTGTYSATFAATAALGAIGAGLVAWAARAAAVEKREAGLEADGLDKTGGAGGRGPG